MNPMSVLRKAILTLFSNLETMAGNARDLAISNAGGVGSTRHCRLATGNEKRARGTQPCGAFHETTPERDTARTELQPRHRHRPIGGDNVQYRQFS